MPFQAQHPSLGERIQTLSLAPDLRDILAELAARIEETGHAEEFTRMLGHAATQPAPLRAPTGPRHRRDRHGLRLIKGGLGGLAPLGAGLRWVARSKAHKVVAWGAGLSVATAAVASAPVMASLPGAPHPHTIVLVHRHHRRRQGWQPTVPVPGLAAHASTQHHRARDSDDSHATPTPGPSPTDSEAPTPTPAPSATATGTGMPWPTATPTAQDNG